ncbi:MAG: hypothetical protein K6T17_00780 [Fimbriimonadales bacterium]|nr:hypothetical protein [Fimbriimonadales bacterium]
MRRARKVFLWLILLVLVLAGIWLFPVLKLGWTYLSALRTASEQRVYTPGACLDNLKQLGSAFALYLEAEGAYPPAEKWMDEISRYLRAGDLPKEEQEKKLRCPDLPYDPNTYGYAFFRSLSGKWKDEIPEPENQVVVFDSTNLSRNANDDLESVPDPPRPGGNNALYADGRAGPVKSPATSGKKK